MNQRIRLSLGIALLATVSLAKGEPIATYEGHQDSVLGVAFGPEGRRLASVSSDGTVKVWDTASRSNIATSAPSGFIPTSVAFSPDGSRLATGSDDGTVKVWDPETCVLVNTLSGDSGLTGVAFSPDSLKLASGSADGTVKIWDVATGKEISKFSGHGQPLTSVAFSPDGNSLASGSADGSVIVWDATSGQETGTLSGHARAVTTVAFSPDGSSLASGSDDGTVKVRDPKSGVMFVTIEASAYSLTSITFSRDGSLLASADRHGRPLLWEVASGRQITALAEDEGGVICVAFSPVGSTLACGSAYPNVTLWDTEKAAGRVAHQAGAEAIYKRLYESTRLIDRREGLIEEETPIEALELVIERAINEANVRSTTLISDLRSFIETEKTADFKAEKDSNYKDAKIHRDALARNLLVIKAAADYVEGSSVEEAKREENSRMAIQAWLEVASAFIIYYPRLQRPKFQSKAMKA